MNNVFYVGTRGSQLALWQAQKAISLLKNTYPEYAFEIKIYSSAGDRDQEKPLPKMQGLGVFTAALDQALLRREIHLAVHSHKDLPINREDVIVTAAVIEREDARDVVIAKESIMLRDLPKGAVIGTSSTRRSSQIRALDQSFIIENIRGNVETRINKVLDKKSQYDATLLAYAGVKRLGLLHYCCEILDFDRMLPAPAQGSIALQCLKDSEILALGKTIDHRESRLVTEAERGFLYGLGGGCSMPVAAYAAIVSDQLTMRGKVISPDGMHSVMLKETIDIDYQFTFEQAFSFGVFLANRAQERGAKDILAL